MKLQEFINILTISVWLQQQLKYYKYLMLSLIIIVFLLLSTTDCFRRYPIKELPDGFAYLADVQPSIKTQVRYATKDNFIGRIVPGYLSQKIIVSIPAAYALKNAQSILKSLGYSLLIYDSYRPQKGVDQMIRWTKQPQDNRTKIFYPYMNKNQFVPDYLAVKSGHTRGSTIDLTIINEAKQPWDQIKLFTYKLNDGRQIMVRDDGSQFMCGFFDLIDESSHHDSLLVTQQCTEKRNLLREVMKINGFRPLQEEWWHYTLIQQPYPATYFDFDIQ